MNHFGVNIFHLVLVLKFLSAWITILHRCFTVMLLGWCVSGNKAVYTICLEEVKCNSFQIMSLNLSCLSFVLQLRTQPGKVSSWFCLIYAFFLTETLRSYFSQYGEVVDCVIMKDKTTNQSRGFGFVKFKDPNCVGTVLASRPHTLDGRNVSCFCGFLCVCVGLFSPDCSKDLFEILACLFAGWIV